MTAMETPVFGHVTLIHEAGLHARPAVKLTKLAKTFSAAVEIASSIDGPWVDAKSVAKVMAMKVPRQTELQFRATGDDAAMAISALTDLVNRDFDDTPENG